jgi:hypothetical protein
VEASSTLVSRLIQLHPLIVGVVATALAAFGLTGFIAIGSAILPSSILDRDEITPSAAILVGSGITAFVYAVLTRLGLVDLSIVLVAVCSLIAIAVQRAAVMRAIRSVANAYRTALADSRFLRTAAQPSAALLWIYSIAPPRDGDVMRYHLAHIRQIIRDGRWETIPDYHYAFPFGWTLNYLPFERLHFPEAAALVNVGLWLVVVAGLLHVAATNKASTAARLGIIALFVHPFVMRTFASAMADGYAILVVFAIAALVMNLENLKSSGLVVLGFISWIGVQSRYQHIAWGIAASVLVAVLLVRRGAPKSFGKFAVGAAGALFLSAPFYLANAHGLGNPFWPLLVKEINGVSEYSSRVAIAYTSAMTGMHNPAYIYDQLWELIWTSSLFPIALISIAVVLVCLRATERRFRDVAILGALFLLLWIIAEPKLFPRHVLLLLPIVGLLCAPVFDLVAKRKRMERLGTVLAALAIVVFVSISTVLVADYALYDLKGDAKTYHRFTWYYPTYDWVNRSTPPDARFLVITFSGHSYYLDRSYRRADPWLSGVVDWSSVNSGEALGKIMKNGGYEYLIYDDRNWTGFVGGAEMKRAVSDAIGRGLLTQVHSERERLYTSRATRDFDETVVGVYRLAAARIP